MSEVAKLWPFKDCACGSGWTNKEVCLMAYEGVRWDVLNETKKVVDILKAAL